MAQDARARFCSGYLRLLVTAGVALMTSLPCAGHEALAASGVSSKDEPTPETAEQLIARLRMAPIPVEGGWFTQTWRASDMVPGSVLPARYNGRTHPAGTAIAVVETEKGFSALHRLATDEVWHFYGGSPIVFLLLAPDGTVRHSILDASHPVLVVPQGVWQGSHPVAGSNGWSFAGTTMAPGFIPEDFEAGHRAALIQRYPEAKDEIRALTRVPE